MTAVISASPENANFPPPNAALSLFRNSRRNSRDSTRTGRKKLGRQGTRRVASRDNPPPVGQRPACDRCRGRAGMEAVTGSTAMCRTHLSNCRFPVNGTTVLETAQFDPSGRPPLRERKPVLAHEDGMGVFAPLPHQGRAGPQHYAGIERTSAFLELSRQGLQAALQRAPRAAMPLTGSARMPRCSQRSRSLLRA